MGFIYEVVPEEDREFLKSMGLKDCWGQEKLNISKYAEWCADRDENAYLINIGGGYREMPHYYDLWWNGDVIRMEVVEGGTGSYSVGVEIVWNIVAIQINEKIWDKRDRVLNIIKQAFENNTGWCDPRYLNKITVKVNCEPEKMEEY